MNLSENIQDLFKSMFPDSKLAQQFTRGRKKSPPNYLIGNGFQHPLHSSLIVRMEATKFSLLIDETTKSKARSIYISLSNTLMEINSQ
jgi:hypothetical protein